ncbi:hypothetical protein ADT71_17360 [Novosphingobium sp. ST904]|nr:hypothetical protein ADT71_17360 [Novosphingobium sp. ST904]
MQLTSNQVARYREDAVRALQRGDGRAALAALEPLATLPDPPLLSIAQAHLMASDPAGAEAVLERVLAADPRNIGALLLKGDSRTRLGDSRAAIAFYKAALDAASRLSSVPPALQAALGQAQRQIAAFSARYEDELRARLANDIGGVSISPRIAEALDILTGKREVFVQQPQSFYFPGLPQIQYYEREQFDWVSAVEAETEAIREELLAVLAQDGAFRPYVESEPGRPAKQNSMVGDPRWGAWYLWRGGEAVAGQAERCPRTMAALEHAPIPRVTGRSPMALFSRLQPGMHIPAHTGFLNTRLICHLPLVVPAGCRFRVGNETRQWEEGKLLIFDDSMEHEAWNDGSQDRVVLLFEVWRPEISAEDRAALTVMFEYISAYDA